MDTKLIVEFMGVLTGAVCVLLAVRENIWNWPIGITNNIIYFVIFWRSKLYADACLQLVYITISIYGWWKWLHKDASKHELTPTRIREKWGYAALAAGTAIATVAMYFVLHRFTDSNVPLGDAFTTALSLTAQFLLSRKLIENWIVWIIADVIYIGLYCYKGLFQTAGLYAIFIVLCVMGYRQWTKSMNESKAAAAVA
jgi:nicotinamide mononucleotide transporter